MNPFLSEIIVGIDFGTTYSGVSWAVNGGAKKIRLIINWPNPAGRIANSDKVPSLITYKDGKPDKWGYSVKLSEHSFKWIKILLEPELESESMVKPVRDSQDLLEELGKTADTVVADYLRFLWKYTVDDIKKYQGPDFETTYNISIILTVPAMWSPAAKDKTLRAAEAAGLPPNITLVTEPEAAALSTLKDKEGVSDLKEGDAFVICDAGGGTVDLISYRVARVDPFQIEECVVGIGELCGSVFLDSEFEKYISTIVGEDAYLRIRKDNRKKMLQEFEYGIKRAFCGDEEEQYSVDLRGVEDNTQHGIFDGTITVKGPLVKTIFDRICGRIEYLVDQQLSDVKEKGLPVKAILLVGGFGENRYLHNRLENCYRLTGIKVLQSLGAWSSICRGATLWGLEHPHAPTPLSLPLRPPSVLLRLARYSYGIVVHAPFDKTKHLEEDRWIHAADGAPFAANQMKWLVKWGDVILEGRVVELAYGISLEAKLDERDGTRVENLYYCDDRSPPNRFSPSVKRLCQVTYNIPAATLAQEDLIVSPVDKTKKYMLIEGKVEIVLRNADLDFRALFKGKLAGHCIVKYMENLGAGSSE